MKKRLDILVYENGFTDSREKAKAVIMAGQVYVNGQKAGTIAFDPWQLDVTSYLKEGCNTIDVHVIGSLKNLLGPHYRNPAPGLASPWHWKNVDKPIPGKEYQMVDYGLMEDFELIH